MTRRRNHRRRIATATTAMEHTSTVTRKNAVRKESNRPNDDDDDDDDDFQPTAPSFRTTTSVASNLEDSDSDEEKSKKPRRKIIKTDTRARQQTRKGKHSRVDSNSYSSDEERSTRRKRRKAGIQNITRHRTTASASREDTADGENPSTRRASPRNKKRKISYAMDPVIGTDDDSSDDDEEEEEEDRHLPNKDEDHALTGKQRTTKSSQKRAVDDEDEFVPDEDDSDEDDVHEREGEDVWSNDDTSEDENVGDVGTDEASSDDHSDDASSAINQTSPHKLPQCTSKYDAITNEPLPEKHVCYFSPDQQSRQCFCLETLRRVALSSPKPKFRSDLSGAECQTFLQPPHFRSAMSDDLLDQIASRFGREALDLHGPYYTRPKEVSLAGRNRSGSDSDQSDDDHYHVNSFLADSAFRDRMNDFMSNAMGSQDLYVCPVCYTVAHRRLLPLQALSVEEESSLPEDELAGLYPTDYTKDPIAVLSSMDKYEMKVASMCCFRKVTQLKEHLRADHDLDTQEVDGNDLYKRYKIRATDGLLQRYLNSGQKRYKRSMQSYWSQGNNCEFVYLANLVWKSEYYRELVLHDSNPNEDAHDESIREAQCYIHHVKRFFDSFAPLTENLWNIIADPFRKYDEVADDFIDNENSEVEEDSINAHRAYFNQSNLGADDEDEQELIEYYEQRYREEKDKESDEEEGDLSLNDAHDLPEGDHGLVDSDDNNIGSMGSSSDSSIVVENDSSDDDEWERNIKSRRGMIGRRNPKAVSSRRHGNQRQRRRITVDDTDDDDDD